jgi:hypothetical protein
MSLWRQIISGVRKLTNRASSDQDVSEEEQNFLDEATAEFTARRLTRRKISATSSRENFI